MAVSNESVLQLAIVKAPPTNSLLCSSVQQWSNAFSSLEHHEPSDLVEWGDKTGLIASCVNSRTGLVAPPMTSQSQTGQVVPPVASLSKGSQTGPSSEGSQSGLSSEGHQTGSSSEGDQSGLISEGDQTGSSSEDEVESGYSSPLSPGADEASGGECATALEGDGAFDAIVDILKKMAINNPSV